MVVHSLWVLCSSVRVVRLQAKLMWGFVLCVLSTHVHVLNWQCQLQQDSLLFLSCQHNDRIDGAAEQSAPLVYQHMWVTNRLGGRVKFTGTSFGSSAMCRGPSDTLHCGRVDDMEKLGQNKAIVQVHRGGTCKCSRACCHACNACSTCYVCQVSCRKV